MQGRIRESQVDSNPFQSPAEDASLTGGARPFPARLAIAFFSSMFVGAIAVAAANMTPYDTGILGAAIAVVWCTCAAIAVRRRRILEAGAEIVALLWGYLISFIAVFTVISGQVPLGWPRAIGAFIIVPAFLMMTVLPLWFFARWLRRNAT